MFPKNTFLIGFLFICLFVEYFFIRNLYLSGEIPDKLEFFFDVILILGFTVGLFLFLEKRILRRKTSLLAP